MHFLLKHLELVSQLLLREYKPIASVPFWLHLIEREHSVSNTHLNLPWPCIFALVAAVRSSLCVHCGTDKTATVCLADQLLHSFRRLAAVVFWACVETKWHISATGQPHYYFFFLFGVKTAVDYLYGLDPTEIMRWVVQCHIVLKCDLPPAPTFCTHCWCTWSTAGNCYRCSQQQLFDCNRRSSENKYGEW